MIALDSSALVAVALNEADASVYSAMISENRCHVGWPTLFETHLAVHNRVDQEFAHQFVISLTTRPTIPAVAFEQSLFDIACAAFDRFGKGRHRAALNFGDCMSYAVAKAKDVPLLFKGDDFRRTDIRPALP